METGEGVKFEVADGVGLITLDRPERLNALSDTMHLTLDAVWLEAARREDARVIVLTGAGRAFTAGADMARLDRLAGGDEYDIPRPGIVPPVFESVDAPAETLTTYTFPLAIPKPVIAAVNGPCLGAGVVIAASCDIRFASPSAFFAAAFAQRGVVAEFGLAWMLPRLVGRGLAADIMMSGRRVDAEEAARIGLVSRVIEDEGFLDHVLAYARDMAVNSSPRSTRLIKQQLWAADHQSYADASGEAWDLLVESFATHDFAEGILSFREKRSARFTGR